MKSKFNNKIIKMGLLKSFIVLLVLNSIATTGYLTYTFIQDTPDWDICRHFNISLLMCDIFIVLGLITFISYLIIRARNNGIGVGIFMKSLIGFSLIGFFVSHGWLMQILITEDSECRNYLRDEHKDYWRGVVWTLVGFALIILSSILYLCRHIRARSSYE